MSWNFITRAKKHKDIVTLESDPARPPMQDIPKAGSEWKLPPPLMEGQTITYRFYDDISLDVVISAVAARSGQQLVWVPMSRVVVPRKMIGTFKPLDWTFAAGSRFAEAREQWLKARAYFYLGEDVTSSNFAARALAHRLTFRRVIYRHHEDLLVNGRKDSTFCGFGCKHKRAGEIVIY